MAVIITEDGIAADDWADKTVYPFDVFWSGQELPEEALAVEFPNDRKPEDLVPWLDRIEMIRVEFPSFADGRGFSLARRLRTLGYKGRLRAAGPVVSDQHRAAVRVGFDEIELPESVAARQPAEHWVIRKQGSYQQRLAS
ncbi:DUF934 domain-containing protein [Amaricoccus tamworthensis]|uniref:DUF934 domain-containing protein n=1 Tax=Amaricoccus tamworthensis TaxID=57002 RepID=UPI003C7DBA11